MPKTKSKVNKSKLTKKVHIPVWIIVVGVLVLVGLGIVFVRNSYASGGINGDSVYCSSGYCSLRLFNGNQQGKHCQSLGGKRGSWGYVGFYCS